MTHEAHDAPGGTHAAVASDHGGHPTPMTYFAVAMILSFMTAIEVVVFYFTWLGAWIIAVLALLSGAKFALVAMFYMHLKYEHRLFSVLFVTGLVLSVLVTFALLGLFRFF